MNYFNNKKIHNIDKGKSEEILKIALNFNLIMIYFIEKNIKWPLISWLILLFTIKNELCAQIQIINEDTAVDMALNYYPQVKLSNLQVEQQNLLKPASFNLSAPELLFQAPTGNQMRPGVLQHFDYPGVYNQQIQLQKEASSLSERQRDINFNQLKYNVRNTFIEFQYWHEKSIVLKRFDSIFSDLVTINEVRYRVGQISNLEKIGGETRYKNLQFQKLQSEAELTRSRKQLLIYMGSPNDTILYPDNKLKKYDPLLIISSDTSVLRQNPMNRYYTQHISYAKRALKVEKAKSYPGGIVGWLNQASPSTKTYYRLEYGLTLPIWFWQYKSKINAAKKGVEISESQSILINYQLNGEYYQAQSRYKQYSDGLKYYEQAGLLQAAEVLKSAATSYRLGSISYYVYLQNIEQAFTIELNYLEALKNYNQSILYLKYLKGEL